MSSNWVEVCAAEEIDEEDVVRFDHEGRTLPFIAARTTNISRRTVSARTSRSTSPTA